MIVPDETETIAQLERKLADLRNLFITTMEQRAPHKQRLKIWSAGEPEPTYAIIDRTPCDPVGRAILGSYYVQLFDQDTEIHAIRIHPDQRFASAYEAWLAWSQTPEGLPT